jgi:hypothetical protein
MSNMTRPINLLSLAILISGVSALAADAKYQNDFEKAEVGSVPEEIMVLDGNFAVKEESGNKFLELPGAPLDTFGVLFGPNMKESAAVSARVFGTASGRKFPAFDVGLNGVGGYKLRVSPARRLLELYRGDAIKTSVPLKWESGKWTHLKLQVLKSGEKHWKIEGKCWQEGAREPAEPTLLFTDTEPPLSGRASVTGLPYSGTPIRFDDLLVSEAAR